MAFREGEGVSKTDGCLSISGSAIFISANGE